MTYLAKRLAIASFVLALVASACGSDDSGTADPTESDGTSGSDGAKVALVTCTTEIGYCSDYLEGFEAVIAETDIELVNFFGTFDPAEQASQVQQAIAGSPDGVVVFPADPEAVGPSLQRLADEEIPVIVTNARPSEEFEDLYVAYTGPDDYLIGRDGGSAMVAALDDAGIEDAQIFIVEGAPGTTGGVDRTRGFTDEVSEIAPDLVIAGAETGEWSATIATEVTAAFLAANPDTIDGIYAHSDEMMSGVLVALDQAGIDPASLVLVGSNCDAVFGLEQLDSGVEAASVLQSAFLDGAAAATAMIRTLDGEAIEKVNILPHPIITSDNIDVCRDAQTAEGAQASVDEMFE